MSSCVVVLDRCPLPDDAYDEDELNARDVNRDACAGPEIVAEDLPITLPSDPPLEILRCDKCQYETKIASLYRNHVAKHSLDLDFKCPSCDFSKNNNIEFVEHFATHQTGNVLQCYFCAKKFTKAQMKPHMLIHRAAELYDCSMCEFSTNYIRTIKKHMEAFHVREFKCNKCDQRMTKYELLLHSKSAHSSNNSLLKIESLAVPKFAKSSKARFEISDNDSQKQPVDTFSLTRRRTPKDVDTNNHESYLTSRAPYQCRFCGFSSIYKASVRRHVESFHSEEYSMSSYLQGGTLKPAESIEGMCSKSSEMKTSSLPVTITKKGEDGHVGHRSLDDQVFPKTPYNCPDCSFYTLYKHVLQRHIERLHIKPQKSDACNQVMTKHDLQLHKNSDCSLASTSCSELAESRGQCPETSEMNPASLSKPCNVTPPNKAQSTQESNRIEIMKDLDSSQVSNSDFFLIKQYKFDTCDQVMTKHDIQLHRTFHSLPASTLNSETHIRWLKTSAKNHASLSESCEDAPTVALGGHEPLPDSHNSVQISPKHYDCPDCCFSTVYKNSLQRHHQSFHINQHQCNECHQVMTKHDLRLHKTSHSLPVSTLNSESLKSRGSGAVVATLVESDQIDPHSPPAMTSTADNPPRTYKSHSLPVSTLNSESLKSRGSGAVVATLVESDQIDPRSPPAMTSTADNLPRTYKRCSQCVFKTTSRRLLKRHVVKHLVDNAFVCPKCGLTNFDNSAFVAHPSSHSEGIAIKCCYCCYEIPKIPLALSIKECHVVIERVELHGSGLSVRDQSDPTESQSAAQDRNLPRDGSKLTFRCSKCVFRTKKKKLLKKHVAKHLQDFRLTCPVCGLKEMSSFNFSRHIEEHQQQRNVFKCCFCDCRPFISRNTVAGHLNKHRPVTLVDCPKCEFSSHRTDLLNDHMKASHMKRYQCYVCGEVMSRFRLGNHIPNAHKQQLKVCRPIRMVSSGTADQEQSQNDLRQTFKYNQQMDAKSIATLADHELTEHCPNSLRNISRKRHGDTDKDDGPMISDGQLVGYESMDLEPPVNQTKPGLATPQSRQSISNISQRNPQSLQSSAKCTKLAKPFLRCSNCSFKTRIKSLLKRHVVKHLIDSRFACTKCHFKESCSFKFARHWLCHDTGPDSQKVRCCFCPVQYNRSSCYNGTFARHLGKHRTVDLFDCSKCKFSCSNRFKFDRHSKTHAIKQACVTCGKFMTLYRLSKHADSCQSSEQTVVPSSHSLAGSEDMEIEEDLPSSTVLAVDSSSHFMLHAGSSIQKCPEMSVEGSDMTEDIDEQVLCMLCKNWLSLFDYVHHECSRFNAAMNATERGSPIVPASDTSESLLTGLDAFLGDWELLNSDDYNILNDGRTIEISPTDSARLSDPPSAPGFSELSGGHQDGELMGSTTVRSGESSQTHSQPHDQVIIRIPSDSEDSYGSQCFFCGWRSQ